MAGTLSHVTIADRVATRPEVAPDIRSMLDRYATSYRLGAVFVDLPYYERLWLNGLRTATHRNITFNAWGTAIHVRTPRRLMIALLDRACGQAELAFALGALTHYAVDILFHRAIEAEVLARGVGEAEQAGEHKAIEDQMDYHVHQLLLGHPGIGTPYARQKLLLFPPHNWIRHARQALAEIHRKTPGRSRLWHWQCSLAAFGLASSVGQSFWLRSVDTASTRFSDVATRMTHDSIDLAARFVAAGWAYHGDPSTRDQLLTAIPNCSMADGSRIVEEN